MSLAWMGVQIISSFGRIFNCASSFIYRVRLPPPAVSSTTDGSTPRFVEGEEIEVFSRASDQESCGWWRAVIKMIKGDFHVVEYLGWETTYTEVLRVLWSNGLFPT